VTTNYKIVLRFAVCPSTLLLEDKRHIISAKKIVYKFKIKISNIQQILQDASCSQTKLIY